MPNEPTLAELLKLAAEVLEELLDLIIRRARAKALRDRQKDHPQAKHVSGYGTLTAGNPSDSDIEDWSEGECLDFGHACQARCEELA